MGFIICGIYHDNQFLINSETLNAVDPRQFEPQISRIYR